MRRIAMALGLLAAGVGCNSHSGFRGPIAKRSGARGNVAAAPGRKSSSVAALEFKHKQSLRLTHAQAIGDILGHRWSEDERLLAVWSASAVVVFDAQSNREHSRYAAPANSRVTSAGFSPDGRWVVVASRPRDAQLPANLGLFALGDLAPKRTLIAASGNIEEGWQVSRDSQTIAWPESRQVGPNAGLWLHVDNLADGASRLSLALSEMSVDNYRGLKLGRSGRVLVVDGASELYLVNLAAGHAAHYASLGDPLLSASGEAVAWTNERGFVLWSLNRDQPFTLSNPRCTPRAWPKFGAARVLFSEDGRTLATSGESGACLWDTETGRLRTVLRRHNDTTQQEGPVTPEAWVHSDKGIIANAELWDVEHQRLVRRGFTASSARGSQVLLLNVPDESDQHIRMFKVDPQFAVREIAHESRGGCSLDLWAGPLLMAFEHTAVVTCQPKPWIVDLGTAESTRRALPSGVRLSPSSRGSRLTLTTRHGISVSVPSNLTADHPVIRQLESVAIKGFHSGRVWMSESPEWQTFKWGSLDISQPKGVELASGTATQRCGNADTYLVGAHFAWSHPDNGPLALCDLMTGREVGTLKAASGERVLALSADATLALIGGPRALTQFWSVNDGKTIGVKFDMILDAVFANLNTVVGQANGKVITVNSLAATQSVGWELSMGEGSILAADLESNLVAVGGSSPTLRALDNGKVVANLPVRELKSAAFGPNALLLGSDSQRIWLWRLPSPEPVGELLLDSGGVLYVASNGEFETSTPVAKWEGSLSCAVGPEQLPLKTCLSSLYRPGLTRRAFGDFSVPQRHQK